MAAEGFDSPQKHRKQKSDESDTDFNDNDNGIGGGDGNETSEDESSIDKAEELANCKFKKSSNETLDD